jgi:hypothetical protein
VAETIDAEVIATFTSTGSTTLRVARERPDCPILGLTPSGATARRMAVVWGVHPLEVRSPLHDRDGRARGPRGPAGGVREAGDEVVVTAGVPFGTPGTTNALRVAVVKSLSDQEVRNCILIMVNREAYFWTEELAKEESFQICCPLPERLVLERYELELVLRFVLLHDVDISAISEVPDLGQFLTTEMRLQLLPDGKDLPQVAGVFKRTFGMLQKSCGENALRKYDSQRDKFVGPFLISAFELVALGVAANIDFVESKGPAWLTAKIQGAWSDPRADGIYGQGVSTARRLPKTLALGRLIFSEP